MLLSLCSNEVFFIKEWEKKGTYSGLIFEGHGPGCALVGCRVHAEAPLCWGRGCALCSESQTLCHLPVVAWPWPGQDDILSTPCVPLALVMKLLLPLISVGALTARFVGCFEGPLGLAEEAL